MDGVPAEGVTGGGAAPLFDVSCASADAAATRNMSKTVLERCIMTYLLTNDCDSRREWPIQHSVATSAFSVPARADQLFGGATCCFALSRSACASSMSR